MPRVDGFDPGQGSCCSASRVMRAFGVRRAAEWVANLSRSASAETRTRKLDEGALAAGTPCTGWARLRLAAAPVRSFSRRIP